MIEELAKADPLVLYGTTAFLALILIYFLSSRKHVDLNEGGKIRRTMSFTSAACAEGKSTKLIILSPITCPENSSFDVMEHYLGPFPDHANMVPKDQPIVNATILLKGAPTREDVEEAILPLFEFER